MDQLTYSSVILDKPIRRSESHYIGSDFSYYFGKSLRLGCGDPGELNSPGLDAYILQKPLQYGESPPGRVVATDVMTIARMTTRHKYAVSTALKRLDDKERVQTARARNADYAHVRRILQSADTSQISTSITAPITQERYYLGFPTILIFDF